MFPTNFLWGVATASYQVEGAVTEDGRGPSIWDTFTRKPGAIMNGDTGDVTCDQYHRYVEDARLMGDINVGAYRFSLAWPRIFPENSTKRNPKGFDYYKRLIDELRSHNILPCITLYHWDLPQWSQDSGGWNNRDTAKHFADYAAVCFNELSDCAHMWITLNEPFCSSILGHLVGVHAPGITDRAIAYRSIHHLLLAHGLAVSAYRDGNYREPIGITLNLSTPRPATARSEDAEAADRAADLTTRMFLDPIIGNDYPRRHIDAYPEISMPIESNDMRTIASTIDFLGINYYWEDVVGYDANEPEKFKAKPQHFPETRMGWPIVEAGLTRHLHWVARHTDGKLPLYVTENGCSVAHTMEGGRCHDPLRVDYLRRHIKACQDAIVEYGVPLQGYFLWSLIDNFEWARGYDQRFGIIYCDYTTLERVPKDSYYFYRDVIAGAIL